MVQEGPSRIFGKKVKRSNESASDNREDNSRPAQPLPSHDAPFPNGISMRIIVQLGSVWHLTNCVGKGDLALRSLGSSEVIGSHLDIDLGYMDV